MILLEIIKRKHLKIKDISKIMHVSQRTIRMDIEEIDYFLKIKKFDPLYKDAKNGISIIQDNQRISLLYSLINEKDVVTASYLPEERILDIIYQIAMSETPIKIEQFSNSLQVSKSTIVKDIEKAKSIFSYENFELIGTLEGMLLKSDEFTLRSILVNTYIYSMDKAAILDINKLLKHADDQVTFRVYWRIFENSDLLFINDCANYIENSLSIQLSDLKYSLLCGHLAMMIKRIKMNKQIINEFYYEKSIINPLVDLVFEKMKKYLNININNSEKKYLKYLIYTCSYETYLIDSGIENCNVENITNKIIKITNSPNSITLKNRISYEIKKNKNTTIIKHDNKK